MVSEGHSLWRSSLDFRIAFFVGQRSLIKIKRLFTQMSSVWVIESAQPACYDSYHFLFVLLSVMPFEPIQPTSLFSCWLPLQKCRADLHKVSFCDHV